MKSFRLSIFSIIYENIAKISIYIFLTFLLLALNDKNDNENTRLIVIILITILLFIILLSGKLIKKIQLYRRGEEKILNVKYENISFMENRINGPHRLFDFQGAVTVEILYGIDINIKAYIRLGAIATYRILKILRTGNSINIPDIRIIIDPLDPYNYYVKGYDFIDELYLMNNKGGGMKYDRVENLHNEKRDAGIENIFKVIMLVSYIGIATLMTIVVVQEFAHIHSEHEFYISLVFMGIFMIMLSIVSVQMLIEEFIVYYIRFHKKIKIR